MASSRSDVLCPPKFLLNKLYRNLFNNLSKTVVKKLRDASTLKSNLSNPHNRHVIIPNISRLLFTGVYSKVLLVEENSEKVTADAKSSPLYEIKTLERLFKIFGGESLVRFHCGGDVSIITSWLVLKSAIEVEGNGQQATIYPGRLVMPIMMEQDHVKVLIPCGGPEPETDQVPFWCKRYRINELIHINPEQLQYKQGQGVMSVIANTNYTLIAKNQIFENDFILVRGKYLQVYAVATDFNSDARNVIRFKEDFKFNVNKQKFSFASIPEVQGLVMNIPKADLQDEKLVSLVLNKIDEDDIGTLSIAFRNACFNSLGFLTHDTAINI